MNRIDQAIEAIRSNADLTSFNMYELQLAHGALSLEKLNAGRVNPLDEVRAKLAPKPPTEGTPT